MARSSQVLLRDFQMHAVQADRPAHRLPARRRQHASAQEGAAALRRRRKLAGRQDRQRASSTTSPPKSKWNAWPPQLPEFITVDLSGLVKGKSLHVSDLKFPAGIKAVRHGTQNPVVVSVAEPKVNAEDAAAEAAAAEAAAAAAAAHRQGQGRQGRPGQDRCCRPGRRRQEEVISRGDGRVGISLESPASAGLFRWWAVILASRRHVDGAVLAFTDGGLAVGPRPARMTWARPRPG